MSTPTYVEVEVDGPRHIGRNVITERFDAWCEDCTAEISKVSRIEAQDWVDNHHC